MTFFANLIGMLAFRTHALRALAERRALITGVVCFSLGFMAFVLVRNSVYGEALAHSSLQSYPVNPQSGLMNYSYVFSLFRIILYLMLVNIPALIILSNAISGDGFSLSISKKEYQGFSSVLLWLWGILFLIVTPLQWLVPVPLESWGNSISIPMMVLIVSMLVYTLWALQQLSYLSLMQALGVAVLSWFTLPLYYLTRLLFALPFFILIPLAYFGFLWIRAHAASRKGERMFQQHLQTLTLNPQDADAHYQLGFISLKRGNLDTAHNYFAKAIEIDPQDPDYHYFLGRTFELKGEWALALEHYEEVYRISPEYRLGDIFREVGKGYVNTGSLEKGIEFLKFFLAQRSSDPEGRYWLAVALQKSGDSEQMRVQLHMILQQTRSNPGFFRKENREWIYRARMLLRDAGKN